MVTNRAFRPIQKYRPALLAVLLSLFLLIATCLTSFAGNVRVSDPVQVLSVSQVMAEGAKLPYDLDIYTTSTFTGSSSDFVNRTISAHLTSKSLIVIAIDTTHRYLAIVGGKSVPLSTSQYNSAGSAFKNAVSGNHYTDATIAAIQSLESSLKAGSNSGSSKSSNPLSGLIVLWIILIIVVLIVIGAIFRFVRRLLGFAPPSRPSSPSTPRYGDGRDNLGGGTTGSF